MSLIENKTCINCETQCLACKEKHHRSIEKRKFISDKVEIPREIVEKAINLCPDDEFKKLIGEYL